MSTKGDRIETLRLPVKITEEERRERALEAARLSGEHQREKAAEDSRKKWEAERLNGIDATVRDLLRTVESGEENRPCDCEWSADATGRQMQLRRMDTWAIVRSRPMTGEEHEKWAQGDLESWAASRRRYTADLIGAAGAVVAPGSVGAPDNDDAPTACRAWLPAATWDALPAGPATALMQPDPAGSPLAWRVDGSWVFADLTPALRVIVDRHATSAGLTLVYGENAPTLADLAAASTEPASKPRRKAPVATG